MANDLPSAIGLGELDRIFPMQSEVDEGAIGCAFADLFLSLGQSRSRSDYRTTCGNKRSPQIVCDIMLVFQRSRRTVQLNHLRLFRFLPKRNECRKRQPAWGS